jgi:hypothetical protein
MPNDLLSTLRGTIADLRTDVRFMPPITMRRVHIFRSFSALQNHEKGFSGVCSPLKIRGV